MLLSDEQLRKTFEAYAPPSRPVTEIATSCFTKADTDQQTIKYDLNLGHINRQQ